MEHVRGVLSTSSSRMGRMVSSLTSDMERDLMEEDLLSPGSEVWCPAVLLCDSQSMSFEVVQDGVDWWEISMLPDIAKVSEEGGDQVRSGGSEERPEEGSTDNVGHNMGASIVGLRVDIEWGDKTNPKEWYAGKVVEYFHPQQCVQYENGEKEWLVMYRNYDNGVKWRYAKKEKRAR